MASKHMSCDPAHCSTDVTMIVQKVEPEAGPILTCLWRVVAKGEFMAFALHGFGQMIEIWFDWS